jgi:hypothetical protein
MKPTISLSLVAFSLVALAGGGYAVAQIPKTPSPAGAKVYFIEPKNGATVKAPVHVVMGLTGMGIAPAGIDSPETGHHHILIDVDKLNPDVQVPADASHRHFGRGQTETMLDLTPGRHTLQLVLGDRNHVPHNPPVMSEKITITVGN